MTPALVLAVASLLPTITVTKYMGCPQVYELKAPGSSPGYNIVFVSAGFQTEADLENYRCAVADLANGLLTHSPWKEHACQLGFYRMDFVAEQRGIGVDDACTVLCDPAPLDDPPPALACAVALEPPASEHPIWPGFFVSRYDPGFDVHHCHENLCRFVWPSDAGRDVLFAVAGRCTPSAQAIVVVANSTTKGGGGDADPDPNSTTPGLAVITVDEFGKSDMWRRLSHELGHAVGLLDEYDGAEKDYEAVQSHFFCDRNVFEPSCGSAAPWESSCSAHEDADCGPDPNAKCQTVVCGACDLQGQPSIGLYEGAFGRNCGYFRSENYCFMNNYASPACGVCKSILDDKVDTEGGLCFIRHHPMKLRVKERIDLDWCPTPPRPPIPLACSRRDLNVRGFYARVALPEGVRGEVAVRRAWIEAGESPDSSRQASIETKPGRDGSSRRLVLSLGEGAVSPLEWIAEIQRRSEGSKPPVVRVIDDVTGARWTADELTLEIESPE
jgi:hypothetical protein